MMNVYVKLLSGDMFSLDVLPTITCRQFDQVVYDTLPAEIRPAERYQMTLVRGSFGGEQEEEEKQEEIVPCDVLLLPKEGECFYVSLMVDEYRIVLDGGSFVDAYDRVRVTSYVFEAHSVYIFKNNVLIHDESFYYNDESEEVWYGEEGVETEWVGRHSDELSIHIPEDAQAYDSMENLAEKMMEGCPNKESVKGIVPTLSERLRWYLCDALVREWEESRGGW